MEVVYAALAGNFFRKGVVHIEFLQILFWIASITWITIQVVDWFNRKKKK